MNYDKLIALRNRENPFASYVGIVTTKIQEGYAEAELIIQPQHRNPTGVVHGGCLYTLADVVTGSAATSFGTQAATVSGEYHYLSAVKNTDKVKAYAKCLKHGKKQDIFDVELTDDTGTLVGKGIFTYFRLLQRPILFD